MRAVWHGNLEIFRLLVENGADLNFRSSSGQSALMYASYHNDIKMVQELLEAGASIDLQDNNKKSAYELTKDDNIKHLIIKYEVIRKNIKILDDLRADGLTYFSVVPKDLISLIRIELKDNYN